MNVQRSKTFVVAFVASVTLLAAAGISAIYVYAANQSNCQCEGG